ncbi:MAG: Maf family protein [Bacillota bacterium]
MKRLFLASTSPRRRALLATLGVEFEVLTASVDETMPPLPPEKAVEVLATRKAQAAAKRIPEGLIIGADTVVVHRGRVLGKPVDAAQAREMLSSLQGNGHTVFTGVAVLAMPEGAAAVGHEQTNVYFAPLGKDEINAYVATGEPLDKAGAYAAQGLGGVFIRRIEGCYFNVVGLPLNLLGDLLRGFGLNLL